HHTTQKLDSGRRRRTPAVAQTAETVAVLGLDADRMAAPSHAPIWGCSYEAKSTGSNRNNFNTSHSARDRGWKAARSQKLLASVVSPVLSIRRDLWTDTARFMSDPYCSLCERPKSERTAMIGGQSAIVRRRAPRGRT